MNIHTHQMRNDQWSCFATIEGYDYQFYGESIIAAQEKMTTLLNKKRVANIIWKKPKIYVHVPKSKPYPIGYGKNRIDHL